MRQLQDSQPPLRPSITSSGKVLAAEDGGDVEPLDLPDGLIAEGEVQGEPFVINEDEENDFTDSRPTGDEQCQPHRVLKGPGSHRRTTLMSMTPVVTLRTGRGVRLVSKAKVLENHTSEGRSRNRRYRSWLSITDLLRQVMRSRLVTRPPLWRWRGIR